MDVTRDQLRGKVQTVLGLIEPDALGPTLMHEHLCSDTRPPRMRPEKEPPFAVCLEEFFDIVYGRTQQLAKYRLHVPDATIADLAAMKQAGGCSIVDVTSGGIMPDPVALEGISRATGVNVIMGCGYYVDDYLGDETRLKTADQFAEEIVGQVLRGAWGTSVRAGIIGEIGCQSPWTELEKRVMRGSISAQQQTGASVSVHPGRNPDQPMEIADFARTAGADLSRIIICHIDRTIFDTDRMLRLADIGCVLEFDLFGIETTFYPSADIDMPNDGVRLRLIKELVSRGHIDRVLISHDIDDCTRLRKFGGHGYSHIYRNVVPLMRTRGFTETDIERILVDNPKRLLTFS
jgi:phosphotriesterase-related protein